MKPETISTHIEDVKVDIEFSESRYSDIIDADVCYVTAIADTIHGRWMYYWIASLMFINSSGFLDFAKEEIKEAFEQTNPDLLWK